MKSILCVVSGLLLLSGAFVSSCKKDTAPAPGTTDTTGRIDTTGHIDTTVTPVGGDPSRKEIRLDTNLLYAAPLNFPLDLNGDGIADVKLYAHHFKFGQTQTDTSGISPMHDGIEIARLNSTFYMATDTSICDTGSVYMAFYNRRMCAAGDPHLSRTDSRTYAYVGDTSTAVSYAPFDRPLMIYAGYFSSSAGGGVSYCGMYHRTSTFLGSAIRTQTYILFRMGGRHYRLKLSNATPVLTLHTITEIRD